MNISFIKKVFIKAENSTIDQDNDKLVEKSVELSILNSADRENLDNPKNVQFYYISPKKIEEDNVNSMKVTNDL